MVKYLITLFVMCIVSTLLYQQPACNAKNAKPIIAPQNVQRTPFAKLGKEIRAARLENNWSESDFANRIEISEEELNRIETGKKTPSKEKLYQIEEVLEKTFEME
jgi:ribosome-binding protein aMBF1 (putative translation factor)